MITEEQRKLRVNGIGGSDAAAILGVCQWRSPLEIYLEKIGEVESATESAPMKWGSLLEKVILDEYVRETNKEVEESQLTYTHPSHPWMFAHVDGLIKDGKGILECKTASAFQSKNWGEPGTDQIPFNYLIQVAHYLAVLDREYADIAVLIGGNDFRIYRYDRNKDVETKIIEKEKAFWINHVQERIPPMPIRTSDITILPQTTQEEEKPKIADEEVELVIENILSLQEEIKKNEKKIEELKILVGSFLGNTQQLINSKGDKLITWKYQNVTRFDSSSLKKELPSIYNKFLKQQTTRIFKIHNGEK